MGKSGRPTKVEDEASTWLVRLESEDVSLDDHHRFREWLARSKENQAAYAAMSGTWDRLDALKPDHVAEQVRPIRRAPALAFAAVALVAVALAALASLQYAAPLGGPAFATGIGQRSDVVLVDGSSVELSAGTRLETDFSSATRRVRLESGEALFDVEHDPAHPFVVETPYGDVRVLGTSFVVKLADGSARATVLRGRVEGAPRSPMPLGLGRSGSASVVVNAGEEITLRRSGAQTARLGPQALERRLAWREGMLAFDGETLREAVADVERQTGVSFEFEERRLGDLRIGGYLNAADADAFITLLESNLGLVADRRGDRVLLRRGGAR